MADSLRQTLSTFQTMDDKRGNNELPLRNVWYIRREACLERVILQLGDILLAATADEDDDTLSISEISNFDKTSAEDASKGEPWAGLVGKSFGWGWATVNQQGYCDGVMLSFSGIEPQVCLNVMASSIKIAAVGAFSKRLLA